MLFTHKQCAFDILDLMVKYQPCCLCNSEWIQQRPFWISIAVSHMGQTALNSYEFGDSNDHSVPNSY